jgi:hypothetical protein
MEIGRLSSAYIQVDSIYVQSINVDPINKVVYASVSYCYIKDGKAIPVEGIRYDTNQSKLTTAVEEAVAMGFRGIPMASGSVRLSGQDYDAYVQYTQNGKSYVEAVLQVLKDRQVIRDFTIVTI